MKKKRVLFINPAKEDYFRVDRIHMGLTLLGGILRRDGHEVRVMDYAFLRSLKGKINVPTVEEVIEEFAPDVVGIAVFSYLYDECLSAIERISRCTDAPIILGGPHFTMFPDDFTKDARVSYIVRDEAENVISRLVADARKEKSPVRIDSPLPPAEDIPPVDLDIAFGSQHLSTYQIQLSRGCPFECTFCNVRWVAGRRVRYRNLDSCIEQIVEAKKRYPNIMTIVITDDVPTINRKRFREFLQRFGSARLGCELMIDNVRADLIDEEIIDLYISAGGQNICLGVESGHPEVFKLVKKGESLDDIVRSARLIKEKGIMLGLCFVIGLPGDNLHRFTHTLRFARSLKPDYLFWNMCVPWPGTEVRRWYEENGKIGDLRNFSTIIGPDVNYKTPPATSREFPEEDRIRAWLMANMETYQFNFRSIKRVISEAINHQLYRSLLIYVAGKPFHAVVMRLSSLRRLLKQFGLRFTALKVAEKLGIRA